MDRSLAREEVFRSVCRSCHGGCGALIFVKDGKVVRVKGDTESPMSRGWMCVKGLATPEIVNHPDRLREPLRRKGQRGSGQWEAISWDDALSEITSRIDKFRTEFGPESIALGQGTGRHHYFRVVRFANQLGTPNWYEPGCSNCLLPRITVADLTYGGFVVGDYYGSVSPKCVMFWGHNPLASNADGELGIVAKWALDKGAIGIAVDPRRSETAKRCQQWLALRPGTDAALALAMIHVIIKDGIYDREFVQNWTTGFTELAKHVESFTPGWAEQITWVPSSAIVQAARTYALTKPAVLEWGLALEQNPNSLQNVRAVAILRALAGNIDAPGGDMMGANVAPMYQHLRDELPPEAMKKRPGFGRFKLLSDPAVDMPSAHIPGLFKAMRTGEPYPIKALLVFGGNPLTTVANTKSVYESLSKLELLTVTDLFMTPTAAIADYVLPAAAWPEVDTVMDCPFVSRNMVMAQQKTSEVGDCKPDEWILDEMARRLGLPHSEATYYDLMDLQLEDTGLGFEQLKERTVYYPPHQYRKHESGGFQTPSGKVELYSKILEESGYDPLPSFKEPPESPVSTPELAKEFPYVLTTGSRRLEFFCSEHRMIPSLRKRRPDPQVEMHPEVAARHGIAPGDWVAISSPRGRIRMKALITEDIHPRVINVEHGWWFPEKPAPDYGLWESNANLLTNDGPPYDPAFGTYQLRALLCRVEKEV